tara:strand:- start:3617 stop:4456 length:840 start_codon:yes stop_codon:yes gene_type:complete
MSNLRALASKVVSACREKGLKQSVIMDVLAKSSGYRSIQCAEGNVQSGDSVTQEEMIVLRTLLFSSDLDYTLDIPVSLFEVAGQNHVSVGDPLFEWMWSLTESGFVEMLKKLLAVNSKFSIVYDYISAGEFSDSEILAVLNDELPKPLADYIEVESIEGGEDLLTVMMKDITTPIYNALVCLIDYDKKQNIFLDREEFCVLEDKGLDVVVVVTGGSVVAIWTKVGFQVSSSSMWSQTPWSEDKLKKSEVSHVGKLTPESKDIFNAAVKANSDNKVGHLV